MEHFDMLDYSVEGELFAVGAMIRTRLEGNYFQHLRDSALSEMSSEDILTVAIQSEINQIIEDLDGGQQPEHLGTQSYWMAKARQCRIHDRDVSELIEEAFKRIDFKRLTNQNTIKLSQLRSDAKSIVRLGYSMAKQKYRKYDPEQLAMTYKSITKATMRVLRDYQDFAWPGMEIKLMTYPSKGKTVIVRPFESFNDDDDLVIRKEYVCAYYNDKG